MPKLIERLTRVRREEVGALTWALAYGFCIFLAYYILRPVRDEISAADRGNLQVLWTVVFLVMLVAVPTYSWVVARWPRGVFVPWVNRFFILNLVGFYAALVVLPVGARPWIDRVFYVWASVFALFVVTVFWGFMADLFTSEQGKRLFGPIAVGGSLGSIIGSALTVVMADSLPAFTLLLIACVPLEIAAQASRRLQRQSDRAESSLRREDAPVSGGDFGAREASLSIMTGGTREDFDAVLPVLEIMGKNIVLQGPAGSGQLTKMANQIAVASGMIAVSESLVYAKRAGLDPDTVLKSIGGGAAASSALSNLGPKMIAGNFEPGFYVKHFIKDMRIAIESADAMNLDLPGLKLAKKLYDQLSAEGGEDDGTQAIYKLIDR